MLSLLKTMARIRIQKRKLHIILILLIIFSFIVTISRLMHLINESDKLSEAPNNPIHEKIYHHFNNLPEFYKIRTTTKDPVVDTFIQNINNKPSGENFNELWKELGGWVTKTQLTSFTSAKIGSVRHALKHAKIIHADVDSRGTQLKLLLTLEGDQKVIFKPKWYDLEQIIDGAVYAGKDRFGAEILAFYLSVLFNKPLVPFSIKRTLSFTNEIMPVASPLLKRTSFQRNDTKTTCIYGKCYFCERQDPICEDGNFAVTGAVIVNVNATFKSNRSLWQRTYKKGKVAMWEMEHEYCGRVVKHKLEKRRIYDLVDVAIFDFLLQNGDRHHYEVMDDVVVFLDNGKGLGNPHRTFLDILAPLYHCCMLRRSTSERLQQLSGGYLTEKLQLMPDIEEIVTQEHLKAIEERLLLVYATIEYCKSRNGSPWQRTYKKGKVAMWEMEHEYCGRVVKHKLEKRRIYDLVDVAIFDFLLQNGDRHHYEVMDDVVVFLDNGKGLGNPHRTFLDILAPLYHCCMLRRSTSERLQQLSGGYLTEKLQLMPDIEEIVTQEHLKAIEERLLLVYATIEYCKSRSG